MTNADHRVGMHFMISRVASSENPPKFNSEVQRFLGMKCSQLFMDLTRMKVSRLQPVYVVVIWFSWSLLVSLRPSRSLWNSVDCATVDLDESIAAAKGHDRMLIEVHGIEGANGEPLAVFRGDREGLIGIWSTCNRAPVERVDGDLVDESSTCFVQDRYSDLLNFTFTYIKIDAISGQPIKAPYPEFFEPSGKGLLGASSFGLDANHHSAVHPSILSFSHDPLTGAGSFVTYSDCRHDSDHRLTHSILAVSWKLPGYGLILFYWIKSCGGSRHHKWLHAVAPYDMSTFSKQSSLIHMYRGDSQEQSDTFQATPQSTETDIRLILKVNGVMEWVEAPKIKSKHEHIASVAIEGFAAHGGILYGAVNPPAKPRYSQARLFYHCHATGQTVISMIVEIAPFHPIVLRWEKICYVNPTGQLARLGIVSREFGPGLAYVVRNGTLSARFSERNGATVTGTRGGSATYSFAVQTSSAGGIWRPLAINATQTGMNLDHNVHMSSSISTTEPSEFSIRIDCPEVSTDQVHVLVGVIAGHKPVASNAAEEQAAFSFLFLHHCNTVAFENWNSRRVGEDTASMPPYFSNRSYMLWVAAVVLILGVLFSSSAMEHKVQRRRYRN